jgi:hypothetical protein
MELSGFAPSLAKDKPRAERLVSLAGNMFIDARTISSVCINGDIYKDIFDLHWPALRIDIVRMRTPPFAEPNKVEQKEGLYIADFVNVKESCLFFIRYSG